MLLRIIIMALVGALIGWFTNLLAVKLIFRPFNPIIIPLFGIQIQGLIPKRRMEIAASIGNAVEQQLFSIEEILDKLFESENKKEFLIKIRVKIVSVINDRIPSIVPRSIRGIILRYVADVVNHEIEGFLREMINNVVERAEESINISRMVEDKINSFDLSELEAIILSISGRELKHIEVLGGILGLIIGLIQGIFVNIFL